jgi:hypothetical protein
MRPARLLRSRRQPIAACLHLTSHERGETDNQTHLSISHSRRCTRPSVIGWFTWGAFGSLLWIGRIASGSQAGAGQALGIQHIGVWLSSSTAPGSQEQLFGCSFFGLLLYPRLTDEPRGVSTRACTSQAPKKRKPNSFPGNQAERRRLHAGSQAPTLTQATNRGAPASDQPRPRRNR